MSGARAGPDPSRALSIAKTPSITHLVDGDEDQLDEEPDQAGGQESHRREPGDLGELRAIGLLAAVQ